MHSLPQDVAQRLGANSITVQLASFGLLPEPAIELSNPALGLLPGVSTDVGGNTEPEPEPAPARKQKRKHGRTRWPDGDPLLRATASENGKTLQAWCPYDKREHTHARHSSACDEDCPCQLHADPQGRHRCDCPLGSGDGHRVAHCPDGSPFRRGGYWLKEVRP